MLPPYDSQAPKKATNLSINSDLLKKSKVLDINLSAALEQALVQLLKPPAGAVAAGEPGAIATYNQEVKKHGSFGDALRSF